MKLTNEHTHLWNDLPDEERSRLLPYLLQSEINIMKQIRAKAVKHHEAQLAEIDARIKAYEKRTREA